MHHPRQCEKEGERDRGRHDQSRPPVAEQYQKHDHHKQRALEKVRINSLNRAVDEERSVV